MFTLIPRSDNPNHSCEDRKDPMSGIREYVSAGFLDKSVSVVKPIKKDCGLPIANEKDLHSIIEWPLIPAVSILMQSGYQCAYTSAHPHGRTRAQIWLVQNWHAQERWPQLPEHSRFEMNGQKYLIFRHPLAHTTLCRDIVSWGIATAYAIVGARSFDPPREHSLSDIPPFIFPRT